MAINSDNQIPHFLYAAIATITEIKQRHINN